MYIYIYIWLFKNSHDTSSLTQDTQTCKIMQDRLWKQRLWESANQDLSTKEAGKEPEWDWGVQFDVFFRFVLSKNQYEALIF